MKKKRVQLQPSLAGFNASKRADRRSPGVFIESYLKAFPHQRKRLMRELSDLEPWISDMLTRQPRSGGEQPKETRPDIGRRVVKLPRAEWIPRERYIPDSPHPRYMYRREGTNIARYMREQLERSK